MGSGDRERQRQRQRGRLWGWYRGGEALAMKRNTALNVFKVADLFGFILCQEFATKWRISKVSMYFAQQQQSEAAIKSEIKVVSIVRSR